MKITLKNDQTVAVAWHGKSSQIGRWDKEWSPLLGNFWRFRPNALGASLGCKTSQRHAKKRLLVEELEGMLTNREGTISVGLAGQLE